jgi:hypothetical protein
MKLRIPLRLARQELDVDGLAGSRGLSDHVHRVIRYNDDIRRRQHAHIRVLAGSAPKDVRDTTDGVREGRERLRSRSARRRYKQRSMLLSNQASDRSPEFGSIGRRKPEAFAIAAEQHRKARMRQMGKSRSVFFRGLGQSLRRHPVYGAERRDYVWRAESVVSRRSDEIKPMSRYFRVLNMNGEGARKLLEGKSYTTRAVPLRA